MRPRKKDRHLPACVYHRHGAIWYVKAGKWTRLGPASDLPRALAEYARLQQHHSGGLAQLIEDALPTLIAGRAPATAKLYTSAARKLQTILAEFAPHQVQPAHVAQLRRGLADTPIMANRCLSVLKLVFDYAVDEMLVESNPCIGAKRNPTSKRSRRVTAGEFSAIRAKASPRLRLVMDLCLATGQRIGDVLKIKRADLLEEGVYIRQAKTDTELLIRWNPSLRAAVDAATAAHGRVASLYVVKGAGARPLAYQPVWRDWRAACEAAGVSGATLHDLRAMAGTETKAQGKSAQALLGHTSARQTATYLRDRELPVVDGPDIGQVLASRPKKPGKTA